MGRAACPVAIRLARLAAAAGCLGAAALALAGCGGAPGPVAPAAHSRAEREWIDNAGRLIDTLNSDIELSTSGGANLATARRALGDQSAVYGMTVAYTLFGDCGHALANVGTPGVREQKVAGTLIAACGRLEHASALFQQAMSRNKAKTLLAATRLALDAVPILARAQAELSRLETS